MDTCQVSLGCTIQTEHLSLHVSCVLTRFIHVMTFFFFFPYQDCSVSLKSFDERHGAFENTCKLYWTDLLYKPDWWYICHTLIPFTRVVWFVPHSWYSNLFLSTQLFFILVSTNLPYTFLRLTSLKIFKNRWHICHIPVLSCHSGCKWYVAHYI